MVSVLECYGLPLLPTTMDVVSAIIVAGWQAQIQLNIEVVFNVTKPFNSGLRQYMCQAARPSGGVDSSNPCRCRGKRLHHHGGDVCCVFVLCVAVSLVVCKKVSEYNLKVCVLPYGINFWSTHACTMPRGCGSPTISNGPPGQHPIRQWDSGSINKKQWPSVRM